jgi:hypothetical protein
MYIKTFEGLGNDTKKSGRIEQKWSKCKHEGLGQRRCAMTFRVKFQQSFEDFLNEVKTAAMGWTVNSGGIIEKFKEKFNKKYTEIFDTNYPENAPICLFCHIIYRENPNGTWRVDDVKIIADRTFNKKERKSGKTKCFLLD